MTTADPFASANLVFSLILGAILLLGLNALVTALLSRHGRLVLVLGSVVALLACTAGLLGSLVALLAGGRFEWTLPWRAPLGELVVGLDPLSAFFLVCVFLVSGLGTLYGAGYLRSDAGKRQLAPPMIFASLLIASMAIIVLARDAVLFLTAWEAMTITSFFLVTYEHSRREVRRAGITYLIASHLGVVCLFVTFGLLAEHGGGFSFRAMQNAGAPQCASICFLLALAGFGTKAGLWPVHVWLPEAHPAAPSHVSAIMSGVMIKMGIYGLLRVLSLLGPIPAWWAFVVLAVGAVSGIAGVLSALAQHDLKRLLAYSSVENIGIIALGVGLGMLGQALNMPAIAVAGYAGGLLHVLNHGLMKGLLFQGAGSVLHATGTRDFAHLGGLARRMPTTALTFLIGAIAISGLPPLNGFVGEWLIYIGAFTGGASLPKAWGVVATLAIPALALIGGLAAAAFVKAFGIAFLGEARSDAAREAHEANPPMRAAMLTGALLCIIIGLWPERAVGLVLTAAQSLAQSQAPIGMLSPLVAISRAAVVVVSVTALLALLRRRLLRDRDVRTAPTWGCGYAAPSARMQYTAPSFTEPLLAPFSGLLARRDCLGGREGYFPSASSYEEHLGDVAGERFLVPAARRFVALLGRFRIIQQGRTQLYLTYVLVTLIVLLIWQLGFSIR